MDFTFSEGQETVAALTRELFDRRVTPERLADLEVAEVRHDETLWRALADADLLGVALPKSFGGNGGGLLELGLLLAEVGYAVAPVPVYATLLLGADAIARHGTEEQCRRQLPEVISGARLLSAALTEPGRTDPTKPTTTARRDGDGWRIDGTKELVPAGQLANAVLVPAVIEGGEVGVFMVDTDATGVEVRPVAMTHREPFADMVFDGVRASADDLLGTPADGARIVGDMHARALVGLCAVQLGVVERALRMAAAYTSTREQFGRPVGSFQAVQQRMADAFIDVEAIRWTTWQAAWSLDQGREDDREARIAKFWAAEGGARVAATAQQVHGGIGIDTSYPLFRYFLWAKHHELFLGSASAHLARLGSSYAELESTGAGG